MNKIQSLESDSTDVSFSWLTGTWKGKGFNGILEKVSFEKGKVIHEGLTQEQRSQDKMVITLELENVEEKDTEVF